MEVTERQGSKLRECKGLDEFVNYTGTVKKKLSIALFMEHVGFPPLSDFVPQGYSQQKGAR